MPRPTGPTNDNLKVLIKELKEIGYKEKNRFILTIATLLSVPARRRAVVNINKLEKYAQKGDKIIIPGKLLSTGKITKPVEVGAFSWSQAAMKKIEEAGGKIEDIKGFLSNNPKGRGVKILV